MWKSFSHSLTLRIFLITGALLVAACAVTYGAIAYLTPLSYTSLLADELRQQIAELLPELEKAARNESVGILQDFARRTGADMQLTDSAGAVLYDTLPVQEPITAVITQETPSDMTQPGAAQVRENIPAAESAASAAVGGKPNAAFPSKNATASASSSETDVITESFVMTGTDHTGAAAVSEDVALAGVYPLTYADGSSAELIVQGGLRAVNQATEAMARLLPYLALIILAFSLFGSFFYARFITRPIVSISGIAERIAALDFRARWTLKRRDEIGVLGDSLNRLSDNLSGAMEALRQANHKLQLDIARERELDRQRLAFFSAASHELKTPITILKGQLSGMLAQVGIYQDREKYLARALEVTGRMEALVREILTISRIESGSFSPGNSSVDLSALLQKQLLMDEELIAQKGLRVEPAIDAAIIVRGSESLLANALDNVLMNAILYSPPGATVIVTAQGRTLCVENTGAAISEESLGQLFTPFYRVEQSRNRKSGGSGLGLYLVKCILELHGAACKIENTGRGVRFTAQFQ